MNSDSTQLAELDALILESVAIGRSSVQIAVGLGLSRQTVDYHIKGLQQRLRVVNRASLVAKAASTGILLLTSWPPQVRSESIRS